MRITNIIMLAFWALCVTTLNAQEKKIEFHKGTLRICSAKNFQITGYEGKEVIIKSLSGKRNLAWGYLTTTGKKAKSAYTLGRLTTKKGKGTVTYFPNKNSDKKKGLKKLGKINENQELDIYFKIEQKDDQLIFRDEIPSASGQLVMYGDESYEIKIPNSLKLVWESNGCVINSKSSQRTIFYDSNPSSLVDFDGEVYIKSNLSNIKLKDVSGPVSINTIGGNVSVEFDKKKPTELYSIYSNNGFIDMTLPDNSSLMLLAKGESIYSDIDFKILEEKEENDFGHIKTLMKLKKGSGKVRMNLDANYGEIYLRKKK